MNDTMIERVRSSKSHEELYYNYYTTLMDIVKRDNPKLFESLNEAKLERRMELSSVDWDDFAPSFPQDPYDEEGNEHYSELCSKYCDN